MMNEALNEDAKKNDVRVNCCCCLLSIIACLLAGIEKVYEIEMYVVAVEYCCCSKTRVACSRCELTKKIPEWSANLDFVSRRLSAQKKADAAEW